MTTESVADEAGAGGGDGAPKGPGTGELFGHPRGLAVLFLTEMWERFCYYGMRALLVYYMTKYLFLPGHVEHVIGFGAVKGAIEAVFGPQSPQQLSSQIYGLYTAFVYLTPLFGGMLADRYFGQRKTVIVGGLIMAVGELVLMVPSLFYVGLLLLIIGNGAFKPNISTQVGTLYPPGDLRRDRAFNIFYVGINLGAFLAGIVCGTIGETYGWQWGFGAAGLGMIGGLVQYVAGLKHLAPDNVSNRKEGKVHDDKPFTKVEWQRIFALVVLCLLNISFWAVYEQQGNTLALWADNNSDRHVLSFLGIGWEMPATWFQSVNPGFIFLFTPFINVLWEKQAKKKTEPSSVTKMAIGCFVLGISFLVMLLPAKIVDGGGMASMWWLIWCTGLLTVGEIYLSPVGLSLVTKISPPRIVSLMMGFWLGSSFFGNYMSGFLGTYWEKMSHGAFFGMLAGISLATGVLMIVLYSPLKKAIGDENAPDAAAPAPPGEAEGA
jgi:POT family proton-dependent oligopeptide transporter